MKYAFLGKGGSGKTTAATMFVRSLISSGKSVLAIDADHNMDLSFNLGVEPREYLGTDPTIIRSLVGYPDAGFSEAARLAAADGFRFRLSPPDEFTLRFGHQATPSLRVLVAGPHTDTVRSGVACSHSLASPLKIYLPLLQLAPHEAVVIDERAGTDPVATGVLAGVDKAFIVVEPTVHSIRVARAIAGELDIAGVRYHYIANKTPDSDVSFLPARPAYRIPAYRVDMRNATLIAVD